MSEVIRILQLEDSATDAELIRRNLQRDGFVVEARRVETREAYMAEVENFTPHVILSDFSLPHFDGLSALEFAHENYPHVPFIFVSGTINEDTAIAAMRGGATDYVLKTNLKRLVPTVQRALKEVHSRAQRINAESRFRDLIEFSPHAIVVLNEFGNIEVINARTEAMFGFTRKQLVGRSYRSLNEGDDSRITRLITDFYDACQNGDVQGHLAAPRAAFESNIKRKDGSVFPAEISLSPMKVGSVLWVSGVIVDISERKAQEKKIARLHRLQLVRSHTNAAGMRIRDQATLCQKNCESFVHDGQFAMAWIGLLGAHSDEGKVIAFADADERHVEQVHLSTSAGSAQAHHPANLAMRENRVVVFNDFSHEPQAAPVEAFGYEQKIGAMAALPLVTNGAVIGVIVLYAYESGYFNQEEIALLDQLAGDVATALEHQKSQDRLSYIAYYDSLTGLANRILFVERLQKAIDSAASKAGGRVAIVLLDIDRFRNINDSFGRAVGDLVLVEVALRLRNCNFTPECVARLGSSSFAILFNTLRTDDELVAEIESNLAYKMAKPIGLDGKEIRVSFHAGTAIFLSHGASAEELMRNASAALHNAKRNKVTHLLYSAVMNASLAEQMVLESRLKRAIEAQQFVLHYQPKIDLASGTLVGLEALIRWQDPEQGLVPPGRFIGILEETGLIAEVGMWVMREAHRQYQDWVCRGFLPPRIAVNVSQLQIRQRHFMEDVLELVGQGSGASLEIEITESLFMEDLSDSIAKLAVLRAAGITIAIDDFGTGFSSLSCIAQLPIDTLKIDRSFITDINKSANHMTLVSTIIALAHGLNLKVVAEGVETEEQSHLLKLLRCDQIQGYLFSRPLPVADVEKMLAAKANPI